MKLYVLLIIALIFSSMAKATAGNHYNYAPKSPKTVAFDRVSDIPISIPTSAFPPLPTPRTDTPRCFCIFEWQVP